MDMQKQLDEARNDRARLTLECRCLKDANTNLCTRVDGLEKATKDRPGETVKDLLSGTANATELEIIYKYIERRCKELFKTLIAEQRTSMAASVTKATKAVVEEHVNRQTQRVDQLVNKYAKADALEQCRVEMTALKQRVDEKNVESQKSWAEVTANLAEVKRTAARGMETAAEALDRNTQVADKLLATHLAKNFIILGLQDSRISLKDKSSVKEAVDRLLARLEIRK